MMGEMGHGPRDKQGDCFGWLCHFPSVNSPCNSRGCREAYFKSAWEDSHHVSSARSRVEGRSRSLSVERKCGFRNRDFKGFR